MKLSLHEVVSYCFHCLQSLSMVGGQLVFGRFRKDCWGAAIDHWKLYTKCLKRYIFGSQEMAMRRFRTIHPPIVDQCEGWDQYCTIRVLQECRQGWDMLHWKRCIQFWRNIFLCSRCFVVVQSGTRQNVFNRIKIESLDVMFYVMKDRHCDALSASSRLPSNVIEGFISTVCYWYMLLARNPSTSKTFAQPQQCTKAVLYVCSWVPSFQGNALSSANYWPFNLKKK